MAREQRRGQGRGGDPEHGIGRAGDGQPGERAADGTAETVAKRHDNALAAAGTTAAAVGTDVRL
jgi:hypothetical protein